MANANSIKAGNAYVSLSMRNELEKGLRSAQRRLKAFGNSLQAIGKQFLAVGSAGLGAFLLAARTFANFGDHIAKMSKRTGVGVQSLSRLAFAAERSGTDIDALEKSVGRMQRNVIDFARGAGTAQRAFQTLGISAADLADLSPEDQFALIGGRLAAIENPTLKAALAMEIFGRSGAQLIPLLNEGAEGLRALYAESDRLGNTLSPEDARLAEELADAWTDVKTSFKGVLLVVGSAIAPVLKKVAAYITDNIVAIRQWIADHKKAVTIALAVVAGIAAVGITLIALGIAFKIAAFAVGALATATSLLGTVMTVATGILSAFTAVLSFLVSPVGLVIAAIVALGATILYVTGYGAKAMDWLNQKFAEIGAFFGKVFTGISNALASGDIGLAANIFWSSLKLAWLEGTNWVRGIWDDLMYGLKSSLSAAWTGIKAAAEIVWHGMVIGWIETCAFFQRAWAKFKGWFTDNADLEADLKRIEDERLAKRQSEDATHQGALAGMGRADLERQERLRQQRARQEEEAAQALADARSEWQGLLDEAAMGAEEQAPEEQKPDFNLDELMGSIASGQGAATRGTFNASAGGIQSLQSQPIERQQLQVLRIIADNTDLLRGVQELTVG